MFGLGSHSGVLFPLLFCHLGAPEVCGGDQILGFPYPGGDIGLLVAGFLESGHNVVAGGLVFSTVSFSQSRNSVWF